MDHLSYVVIFLCLFTPYIEGNVVCLRPTPPVDGSITPEKVSYFSKERVHITCSTRQHRLFGANSWECENGNWKARLSYCTKKTDNIRLKNKETNFSILLDKNGRSCLDISHLKSEGPVYVEVKGKHRMIIVDLKDKPAEYTRHHKLYKFRNDSKGHDYKDLSNYERCITGPGTFIHYCDFINPIKNPVIIIEPGDEDSGCTTCRMCEMIFYEIAEFPKEESTTKSPNEQTTTSTWLPTEETTTELAIVDSNIGSLTISLIAIGVIAGISLLLSVFLVIKVQRKKRRKKKEEVKENLDRRLEVHDYESVKDYCSSIQTQKSERRLYGRTPAYMRELTEFSNSRLRDSDYLEPIERTRNGDTINKRNYVPNSDINVYCRISEISLRNSDVNSADL